MDPHNQPVVIQRIDYAHAFRFTRIFEGFRIAIHPSRMLMALLLILGVYLGGRMLDVMWGRQVVPGEFEQYAMVDDKKFGTWYERYAPVEDVAPEDDPRKGIFDTALSAKLDLFEKMIRAAMALRIGFDQAHPDATLNDDTVIGALRKVCLIPVWLWDHHRGFLIAYLAMFTLLWALLGGAVARSAMVEAAAGRIEPASRCVLYSWRRLGWFIITPLLPLILALLFGAILVVGGFIFFNLPVLDIVGSLLFIAALAIGFVIAVLVIGWFGGVHLMYPALVAEGTDAFDAVSRGYSYFFAHPWRTAWYSLIAIMYGAVTYLVVGLFVFVTIAVTQGAVSTGVIANANPAPGASVNETADADESSDLSRQATALLDDGEESTDADDSDNLSRFDAMFPEPVFGRIPSNPATDRLGATGKVSATLLLVWNYLMIGLVAAYVISYYHAAYANIYLLLRRYTDGTDTAEVYAEPNPTPPPAKDKLEPAPPEDQPDTPEPTNEN